MKHFPVIVLCMMLYNFISLDASAGMTVSGFSPPGDSAKTEKVRLSQWLAVPPRPLANPVFYDQPNTQDKKFTEEEFLRFEPFNPKGFYPEEDQVFAFLEGGNLTWQKVVADTSGKMPIGLPSDQPQIAWLATYIQADRWIKASLEISSPALLKAWLDGEEIGTKSKAGKDEKPGKITKTLKLERGKHLLLVKVIIPPETDAGWILSAMLEVKDPFSASDVEISTLPVTRKSIRHMLDGVRVSSCELSQDGKYYTIARRRSLPGDQSESWTEVRRTGNHALVYSFRHARVSQLDWLPATPRISYVATSGDKATVFLLDFEKGSLIPLLRDVDKLSGYLWSPDENFLIYTTWEEPTEKEGVMRRVQGMPDRQPGWRNRSYLYRYDLKSGESTRLTWGNLSTYVMDISPDSRRAIIGQGYPDFSERPYSRQNVFILDLQNLSLDTILFQDPWGISARFSPDGRYLLATGGPSCFNGAGLNIPEGKVPHNSDTQVYLYDPEKKTAKSITAGFNPSVDAVHWHKQDHRIYLLTTDADCRRLYRYDMKSGLFTPVEAGVEYMTSISFAGNALTAVYCGNQANRYPAWYMLDLKSLKYSLLDDSEAENYRHVQFGEVKPWDFTASTGVKVTGRVYYPPGFDPSKKYPVIVYYYGGITPVGRTFGGRYPFNIWAGNDYLVYVLQPSGAIGFGQEFSSAHVNNWGTTVADEIIEGTKKFLEAHPFADAAKVGCAGASYGGFMTMLLLTRTDIFAAAVAHAGISSISSYWGEGYWGYSYSAGASANSFPWNNKDLYVGQSPLFHADKIHTPLLLTHGDEDTNVPPGESIQMYTALRLLNRPVELVLVKGENHHIVTYSKRILWHNTIMAWWDKQLKGQPEWWEDLYPEGNY